MLEYDVCVMTDEGPYTFEEVEARSEHRAQVEIEELMKECGLKGEVTSVKIHKYPSRPMTMADFDKYVI